MMLKLEYFTQLFFDLDGLKYLYHYYRHVTLSQSWGYL